MDAGIIRADGRSAPFFEAAARDVLLIKRCAACGHWLDPQATTCTGCGTDDPPWEAASGRGTLVSWAMAHPRQGTPGAEAAVLALVELDEGPWLHSRLDPADGTEAAGGAGLRAGLRLTAHFEHPGEGESYPVFRPDGANPGGLAARDAASSPS
ncbi:MAG TPA: OB-fold domain-containing protein [Streptosporangiaceae bacterium]|jgi:hypothetical protein